MTNSVTLTNLEGEPHANVFPDAEPKTIRLTLDAGEAVPPHTHPDRQIVLYLIEGALDLQVGERQLSLEGGDIAQFDGDQEISPCATTESTALLVLARRESE